MPRHEISIDVNEAVKELSDKIRYGLGFSHGDIYRAGLAVIEAMVDTKLGADNAQALADVLTGNHSIK